MMALPKLFFGVAAIVFSSALLLAVLLSCTPPATSGPVVPVDASDASPCSIADALTVGRMIALPDGGVLQVPCGL
jgi:hypothetical protein